MTEIIPAILAKDFEELCEKITRVVNVSKVAQIDICDGKFVPSVSWPMQENDKKNVGSILNEETGLPHWDTLDFEFDLMVADAIENFEFFTRLGPKRIIFHIEAQSDINKFKEFLEAIDIHVKDNIEIGIAINTTTPIDKLVPVINNVDFVQCMGIENIGFQGEPFDERVLNQIKSLKLKYPELIITVDGGVNESTAPLLIKAGANRLVAGHTLMESKDIRKTIKNLENS